MKRTCPAKVTATMELCSAGLYCSCSVSTEMEPQALEEAVALKSIE